MKIDRLVKCLVLLIAASLGAIAAHPYLDPAPVEAQAGAYQLYIEPGTAMLRAPDGSRQVLGKVVVDLRNGKYLGISDAYPGLLSGSRGQCHAANLASIPVGQVRLRGSGQVVCRASATEAGYRQSSGRV